MEGSCPGEIDRCQSCKKSRRENFGHSIDEFPEVRGVKGRGGGRKRLLQTDIEKMSCIRREKGAGSSREGKEAPNSETRKVSQ